MNYKLCAALILERGVEGKLFALGSPVSLAIPKTRMGHGPEFRVRQAARKCANLSENLCAEWPWIRNVITVRVYLLHYELWRNSN